MDILLLSADPAATVLPALDLLGHTVQTAPRDVRSLLNPSGHDTVLVDARNDLAGAKSTCRLLHSTGPGTPLFAVFTEGGLVAVTSEWGVDDILLVSAGPAEVEARLQLALGRLGHAASGAGGAEAGQVRAGELVIDPQTYSAKIKGRPLDLTYKEFELLRFLAQHPGRVFTRDQLLREVWGYDYFGGTRTVDVHVRRLRAKLGSEHEALIGTVRQVGYKFVAPSNRVPKDERDPSRSFSGRLDRHGSDQYGTAQENSRSVETSRVVEPPHTIGAPAGPACPAEDSPTT